MLDVSFSWRWLGTVVGALAVFVVVLVAVVFGVAFLNSPGTNCPPLGNGGAFPIESVASDVPNESVAVALVRDYRERAAPATTTTVGATANASTSSTSTTTSFWNASIRAAHGHFRGKSQVHDHISTDAGVPEHYHVDNWNDDGPMGYVVTADGQLYRVVVGAC